MKSRYILSRSSAWLGALILAISSLFLLSGATQKMKPSELVEKHLISIGKPEARAAIRNRVAKGTVNTLPPSSPDYWIASNAAIISEGRSLLLHLIYPGIDLSFDGKRIQSSIVDSNAPFRVEDGLFITYYEMFKEGLMGGTLTTAWALLDVAGRRPVLEYRGIKKIGGKEYHELRYIARKRGGDGKMRVLMYFDPQTFRHIRTEYFWAMDFEDKDKGALTEEFTDFAAVDGLTLPRTYMLYFTYGNRITPGWRLTFDQIQHNQQLDANAFVLK